MSFTQVCAGFGTLAGLGFGIFAAVKNFDPNTHQSEEMTQSTRIFSELLTQIAMASLQAGSLALLSGIAGFVVDCITCCKCVSTETVSEEYRPLRGIV